MLGLANASREAARAIKNSLTLSFNVVFFTLWVFVNVNIVTTGTRKSFYFEKLLGR